MAGGVSRRDRFELPESVRRFFEGDWDAPALRVEEYPELKGARFYSVRYGSDRAILFIGKGDEASAAFESTLAGLVGREGQTISSRRSGKALLVWERETYAPDINACFA